MIFNIKKLTRSISIEIKTIIGIILFTILLVGLERYQLSQNIIEQFLESKRSKNRLLIDTITPIIGLNISLGLDESNKEYLNYIARQNLDLEYIELLDFDNKLSYSYGEKYENKHHNEKFGINFCSKSIVDSITGETLGSVTLHFSDKDYQMLLSKNRETTLKIFFITFILLTIFVVLIKKEFKHLKKLSENVLAYDPKINNFSLTTSQRLDEVGVIHNAIISMVKKIATHTKDLDEINSSLEDKIKERTKELEEANKKLQALSVTDELTQLSNRRYFEEYFQKNWELAKRHGTEISIIMCDIDHFKRVNDTYGHLAGDFILKNIAQILKKSLKRNTDFIARYGGEEFVIVMYDTDIDLAKELCIKIQNSIKDDGLFTFQGIVLEAVTMSFGINSIIPKIDDNSKDLIENADLALYKAKKNGRNRIVVF